MPDDRWKRRRDPGAPRLRIDRREHHHEPCEQVAEPATEPNRLARTMESAGYEPAPFQIDGLGTKACFDRQRRRDSRYRLRRRQDHSQTGCHCHGGQGLRCGFLGNKCCCIPEDERGVHQVATSRDSPRFGFASAVPRPDVCSRHRCRNSLLLARLAGGYARSLTRPKTWRSAGHRRGSLQGWEIRPACSKICRHDAKKWAFHTRT